MKNKNLRGHIQAYCKLIHLNYASIIPGLITIGLAIDTIIKLRNKNDNHHIVQTIISAIITIIPIIYGVIKEIINQKKMIIHQYTSDEFDYVLEPVIKRTNYELLKIDNSRLVFSKSDNDNLKNLIKLKFQIIKHPKYTLPNDISKNAYRVFMDFLKSGKHLQNDKKLRMNIGLEELQQQKKQTIQLSPTSYFNSICTNDITTFEFIHDDDSSYCLDGYSLVFAKGNSNKLSRIYNLSESHCSNHIGVSTIAITSDHRVIIILQGDKNLQDSKKFNVSATGSLDYKDKKHCKTFNELLIKGLERELCEECYINKCKDKDKIKIDTEIFGYGRFLHRGGKPEFFGISYVEMEAEDLINNAKNNPERNKYGYISDYFHIQFDIDPEVFRNNVKDFLKGKRQTDIFDKNITVNLYYYIDVLWSKIKNTQIYNKYLYPRTIGS